MLRKKRVVHISTVHPPFDTRIFYKECTSLAKAGYEVYLVHTKSKDFDEKKFIKHNIKSIPLTKHKGRVNRFLRGTKQALKEAIRLKADIYHIHDPELLLITSKLKKTGAKVIYDMHEDYYTSIMQKDYIPRFFRKIISNVYTLYERRKAKQLDVVLAEKYYKDKYPEGTQVLNYPILDGKRKNIAYTNNNKLLYTGSVTEDRGALIHAKMTSYIENIEVSFVGRCTEELADEMYKCSKDKQINIKGVDQFIPREEIDKEYNEKKWLAGLAIFPPTDHYMKKELTKFFEYMYAGLPIIISNFPEWEQFVEKYKCGIAVKYDDLNSIKKAVSYLKNNPRIAQRMGVNGQKAVLEELNWNNEVTKLIELYEA